MVTSQTPAMLAAIIANRDQTIASLRTLRLNTPAIFHHGDKQHLLPIYKVMIHANNGPLIKRPVFPRLNHRRTSPL
jgi:hypothetical protein